MNPFIVMGLLLGLAALAFVLYPVLRPDPEPGEAERQSAALAEQRQALYRQIVEVEFDQRVGKLAEADAREIEQGLLRQAAALLAQETTTQLEVEARIEREVAAVRRLLAASSDLQRDRVPS